MAKHFREEPLQVTGKIRRTRHRNTASGNNPATPSRSTAPAQDRSLATDDMDDYLLPYGQAASYRSYYADPALTGGYYIDRIPVRGGIYAFGRGLLLAIAWALRLFAYVFVLLVLLNVLSLSFFRAYVTSVTDAVTSHLPWHTFGLLALDTPFGGVFRGDLSLIALLLFVLDWAVCRVRIRLR